MAAVAVIAGVVDILAGLGDIGMGGGFLGDRGFGATLDGVMTIVGIGLVLDRDPRRRDGLRPVDRAQLGMARSPGRGRASASSSASSVRRFIPR